MSLNLLAQRIGKLKKKSEHDPLSYFYPTAPQRAFLNDESKVKMLLGGNQTGKTACACALLLYHCLNRHPTQKTDPAPVEAVLVTHSHSQSVIIQGKLYSMIPKDTLHPDCEYVHGKGFRGVQKVVRFTNGSIIRIKTANQGVGGGLASATCSLVVIDEPVPMDVFNECLARTLRGGFQGSRGILAITMTPVGAVDVSYLEEMMKQGKISVTRARLTVKDTTPIGLSPLLTEQQITSITNQFLPIDREARINGSFHVAPLGVVFTHFDPERHITSRPVPPQGDYRFAVGIDHGSKIGAQVAVLVCIDIRDPLQPRIYVLDEYTTGETTPEELASSLLSMLDRNDLAPNMCSWYGDGEHNASRGRDTYKMSNLILMRGFESVMKLPHKGLTFHIRRVQKRRHSVYFGASLLSATMARNHFFVHPRCKQLIRSIQNWTMKRSQSDRSKDPYGHSIDSLRYACSTIITNATSKGVASKIKILR
tara:strand:- start:606 stop:2045 length:1440 start_codon:yes stop_codon:yes gene_type:complete